MNTVEVRQPRLSVITATRNASTTLPQLIADLRAQSCQDFEWIVADGGSTDATLQQLAAVTDINLQVSSQADFGIYDALNRAIRLARADFYLVIGADDRLYPEAVAGFVQAIAAEPADVISADVRIGQHIRCAQGRRNGWQGVMAAVSSHSVGTIFRVSLHQQLGFYTHRLPITADRLFIARILSAGVKIRRADFIAGEFTLQGTTGTDSVGLLTESLRVELMAGANRWVALGLFFMRLVRVLLKPGQVL